MTDTLSAILSAFEGPVALFTDFDGVLVEIAPAPDAVVVPQDLPQRLTALDAALDGAFAVISGRTIAEIDTFLVHPFSISGSHGAETRRNGEIAPPVPELAQAAREIAKSAHDTLDDLSGMLIETKPAGVALHYRAAPEREAEARKALEAAIAGRPEFHIISGKKVFEARRQGTDKGRAITEWMEHAPFAGRFPVFVGDDVTDEDGFAAVNALGGVGIKVGSGETAARFRLPDVPSVHQLFDAIARNAAAMDRNGAPERSPEGAPYKAREK